MQPHRMTGLRAAALAVLLLPSTTIRAGEAGPAGVPLLVPDLLVERPLEARDVSELGRAVDPARLAGLRGGERRADNLVDVDGSVEGNTANRVVSGSNTIGDGAFNNANGINTVIQNTGSNVLIQNAMIVTVDFVDPGR